MTDPSPPTAPHQAVNKLIALIQSEPTTTAAMVRAAIVCAVSFGLQLTPSQIGAIYMLTEVVLSWATRTQVTPLNGQTK